MAIYQDPLAPSETIINEKIKKDIKLPKRFIGKGKKKKEKITYQRPNDGGANCDPNHLVINDITFLVNEECIVLYWE